MKKILLFTVLAIAGYFANAQQFVKAYNTTPQTSLTFNCITKAANGNFFIAGLSDKSLYVSEVDALGNTVQEKLMDIGSNTYNLRSMVTDNDGNIVIVGDTHNFFGAKSFLIKISPALSLLLHKTYSNNTTADGASTLIITDVKDFTSSRPGKR